MCQTDYDAPTLLTDADRTCRKERSCRECGRTIRVGEVYRYTKGRWDGRFDSFSACAHCHAATGWLEQACQGWLYGGVGEDLAEHFIDHAFPVKTASLGRLVVGMRRRWEGISVEMAAMWAANGAALAVSSPHHGDLL